MKKYKSNQAKKLLLASLAIPVVVSTLPIDNVFASEIPVLNVYELNGSTKLEWATEMLQENIITRTGFENNIDEPLNLNTNGFNGQQIITNENSFSGDYSLKIGKTTPNLGNGYYDTIKESNVSDAYFLNTKYFNNGDYVSVSMKVKTDESAVITPVGNGGRTDKQINFQTYFNSNKEFKLTQKAMAKQNYLYISNPSEFKQFLEDNSYLNLDYVRGQFGNNTHYTVSKKSNNGSYNPLQIKSVDVETGRIELSGQLQEDFEIGEDLLMHRHINPIIFNARTITNNDWETINFNAFVDGDVYDYNTLLRGIVFRLRTVSEGNTYIDDIQFGHATEVEVYRDKKSIYKGYLSDFHDTTVRDNVKPNKVTNVNGSIANDFNINFKIVKPEDNGIKSNYQIQSIAKNGTRSELSTPQEIEIKTEVVKYKYNIGNQPLNTLTMETQSLNDIVVPLKSINLETDYLHIQSIDGNGNESEVQSFKVSDIVDISNLQELYDKLKDIENNNSYDDFIDFVDEIEGLYGDNLPQDLKEMIDKLGQHHGVNTSFLLLEEGDFRLSTSDINSFGHTKLTAKKQTLTTDFKGDFGVIDARGTQEGWNVSVSATPFTVETFDGFIGSPHQLPMGSLALNVPINLEQVGTVHNSQLPAITLNPSTAIDGQNSTINLLNANKQKGMGEFKFSFAPDALALTVDAVTAKIDTVNYPDQNTPYASTVTWDLVSGPQI